MRTDGVLGCFALTERLAGVNSGLVVQTVAEWCPSPDRPDGGRFLLRTPHDGARKNWISQGLTASWAVVFADLLVGGVSVGPHAFLLRVRDDDGRAVPGVSLKDMGEKTTGNDLDNASIAFHDVWLPRSSLLDRHCDVTWDGRYCLESPDAPTNMELIGQRLFTGRVAVAQGAHEFRRALFRRTRAATDAKPCWAPGGDDGGAKTLALSRVPQLRALYDAAEASEERTGRFLAEVEAKLCDVLRTRRAPDAGLVEAVAAAKVSAVDEAIEYCHRLRQEVGSYALMAGTGFEHTDFLQCCKFAEGDSRVLMMKVARDRVKRFAESAKTRAPCRRGCRRGRRPPRGNWRRRSRGNANEGCPRRRRGKDTGTRRTTSRVWPSKTSSINGWVPLRDTRGCPRGARNRCRGYEADDRVQKTPGEEAGRRSAG